MAGDGMGDVLAVAEKAVAKMPEMPVMATKNAARMLIWLSREDVPPSRECRICWIFEGLLPDTIVQCVVQEAYPTASRPTRQDSISRESDSISRALFAPKMEMRNTDYDIPHL